MPATDAKEAFISLACLDYWNYNPKRLIEIFMPFHKQDYFHAKIMSFFLSHIWIMP